MAKRDFLDEVIAESTARNPRFPAILEAAERRRKLMHELSQKREQMGLSQTIVAERMGTSQSAIARLERQSDAKESMLDRYAMAIGVRIERRVIKPKRVTRRARAA